MASQHMDPCHNLGIERRDGKPPVKRERRRIIIIRERMSESLSIESVSQYKSSAMDRAREHHAAAMISVRGMAKRKKGRRRED